MNIRLNFVGVISFFVLGMSATVLCGIFSLSGSFTLPEIENRWELDGEFVDAYDTSTWAGDKTKFTFRVTHEEFQEVERRYPPRKEFNRGIDKRTDATVFYSRGIPGTWCGPLPVAGTRVKVTTSWPGRTGHVRMVDLDTGEIFRSEKGCASSEYVFEYRISDRNGKVIESGTVRNENKLDAWDQVQSGWLTEWYGGQVQVDVWPSWDPPDNE